MLVESIEKGIEQAIRDDVIKTFRTKKDALAHAQNFGWKHALKIKRRFETVWVVGKKDFQPTIKAGLTLDSYRIPMLKWEKNSFGVNFCPILILETRVEKNNQTIAT